jgi:hypothetical protein
MCGPESNQTHTSLLSTEDKGEWTPVSLRTSVSAEEATPITTCAFSCRMISMCAITSGNNGVLVPHSTVAQELRDPFLIHS